MATLLSIIQDFCKLNALAVPTSVVGSSDTQAIQLFQVLKDLLVEIQTESKFNVTTQELVFSCVPQERQGTFSSLGCVGFQYAIPETFYDRTLGIPLIGPVSEAEWQQLQAMPSAGAQYKFRIRNNAIYLYPAPVSPFHDIAFEYMSRYTTYAHGVEGTLIDLPTSDDDAFVFPEPMLKRGLAFRWKQIKGLPYQADETKFWDLLNNFIARDKVKKRIDVSDCGDAGPKPGIFVPSNSWLQ